MIDLKKILNYTEEQKIEHLNRFDSTELTELGWRDMMDNWKERIKECYRNLKEAEVNLEEISRLQAKHFSNAGVAISNSGVLISSSGMLMAIKMPGKFYTEQDFKY
jgi:L-lactate utilization protein LutC